MPSSAHVFKALADPTRREILQMLKDGELAAGEIGAGFEMSGPSISRHLAILSTAGLIRSRRESNRILYALEAKPLTAALNDFLSNVCPTQVVRRKRAKTAKRKGTQ